MAEILSQQQIDELLGSLRTGEVDLTEIEEQSVTQRVKEYDFLSPKKFTREQFKLLDSVFDNFTRMFNLFLASTMRESCQLEVASIEEEDFREFNNALSDMVLVGIVSMRNEEFEIEDKQILIEIARPVYYSVLDRLLGGSGEGYSVDRNCTEIELALLEYLLKQIVVLLKNAWSNYFDIDHSLQMIETNSRMLQMVQPDEAVAIVAINVELKNLSGNISICLPAASLSEIFTAFQSKYLKSAKKENAAIERQRKEFIMGSLKESPLRVSAQLGRASLALQEVLSLQKGDIIPLGTRADAKSIEVNVGKTPWFSGELGMQKKNYAVKIEKLLNVNGW